MRKGDTIEQSQSTERENVFMIALKYTDAGKSTPGHQTPSSGYIVVQLNLRFFWSQLCTLHYFRPLMTLSGIFSVFLATVSSQDTQLF